MNVTVKKWGNSASVRIPAAIMEAANLSLDMEVSIQVEEDCVTIRPVRRKRLELGDLLAKITPENQHSLVDFGTPRGQEIW